MAAVIVRDLKHDQIKKTKKKKLLKIPKHYWGLAEYLQAIF